MNEVIICSVVGGANAVIVRDSTPVKGETVYLNRRDKRRAYFTVRTNSGVPDIANIDRAITALQAIWGPLPVQDRSGSCVHLTTYASSPTLALEPLTTRPAAPGSRRTPSRTPAVAS